jgi:hypothetical protein
MAEEWLTYSELGERLGVSAEAARQKAIRLRLRRQTANDGKAQVLVDVEDVRASSTPRKPKDQASDDRLTPDELASDERALAALDAHIATLKEMVAKAEAMTERERVRADEERGRAEAERTRADRLQSRLDTIMDERASDAHRTAEVEQAVSDLRSKLAERAAYDARPWWKKIAG